MKKGLQLLASPYVFWLPDIKSLAMLFCEFIIKFSLISIHTFTIKKTFEILFLVKVCFIRL
jgi:hypothetical protein